MNHSLSARDARGSVGLAVGDWPQRERRERREDGMEHMHVGKSGKHLGFWCLQRQLERMTVDSEGEGVLETRPPRLESTRSHTMRT